MIVKNKIKGKTLVLLVTAVAMVFCLLLGTFLIVWASDAGGIKIIFDGQKLAMDVEPVIENGSTLLPLRVVFEALGIAPEWNAADRTITAKTKDISVWLQIGNKKAVVNGAEKTLLAEPMIISGRTLVPLRFIAENFGAQVRWDGLTQTVTIETQAFAAEKLYQPTTNKIDSIYDFMNGTLYENTFEDGSIDGWTTNNGWQLSKDDGNQVFSVSGHSATYYIPSEAWGDYTLQFRFKSQGGFHLNFRSSRDLQTRYILDLSDQYNLVKLLGKDQFSLMSGNLDMVRKGQWNTVKLVLENNIIKCYINDTLAVDFTDRDHSLTTGGISFENLDQSSLMIDDVKVEGLNVRQKKSWVKTGGPIGGLGYDVRISPDDKNFLVVSDNPSGVNISHDGGTTWNSMNKGILVKAGASGDTIPIFCVTIDKNDPNIIWAGTQSMRGIYRSNDRGTTWQKMDNGISEWNEITFRGFAVKPGDSNVVIAAAEITTDRMGKEFNCAKGKIYKTVDGGKNWTCVWSGDSLARVVIFNPTNPQIVYTSTGIFDREAANITGEGILKSTDGGETWQKINQGLESLFVGYLEMNPTDPNTLMCAVCNYTYKDGAGVYKTVDGGKTWNKVLAYNLGMFYEQFTVVTYSPSNPNIVYAGSANSFYRSEDGGKTWQRYDKPTEQCYGPPGIRAGVPISAVVDPANPMTLFVNNYGGGVFKSTDGAKTWIDSSSGYTGADLHHIRVSNSNPNLVYTIGRSGPFRSLNSGNSWDGIQYEMVPSEWNDISMDPTNPNIVIAADEHQGMLFRSTDGGKNWKMVYDNPYAYAEDQLKRQGYRDVEFAPSNHNIVYAGMRMNRSAIDGNLPKFKSLGMYKSQDNGLTWHEINNGLQNMDKNINCIVIHPQNPDVVYAGTFLDGVIRSRDGGRTWSAINNGLMGEDVRSLAMDPKNPNVMYAGLGKGAGLYKTQDGGETWTSASNGLVLECPSYLQKIGQVSMGISLEKPKRIANNDYAASSWSMITSIIVDPNDSNVLYIADYHKGVYMSVSGGESWIPLNEGLSVKAVTSLSISKKGSLLYSSTSGGGVYRLSFAN